MNKLYKLIAVLLAVIGIYSKLYAQTKPNVIYILADDMGYGDLGCYGQTEIRTPNIDELASEGMKFTQHYAGAPVCSPSRAVLMTGRDIGHATIRGNYEIGPHGFGAGLPLKLNEITCGNVMKERGYSTAIIGKWGLGVEGTTGEPNKHGFDYSYGFLNQAHAHYQFPEHLFRNGKRVDIQGNMQDKREQYSNNIFINEALNFINDKKKEPFFLYLAFTTPHAELLVPDDTIFASYKGKFQETPYLKTSLGSGPDHIFGAYGAQAYPNAAYATCITHLDMCVGRLVKYLKEKGIYENTVIIFSSDNGPANEGGANPQFFNSSGGLKGKKRDVYEGGIREPLIVTWPKMIKPGSTSELISGFQDVMPTLADFTGTKLEGNVVTEGISFYPTLMGNTAAQNRHQYLYWEFHEKKTSDQAVRWGKWKGVRHAPNDPIELYDLNNDVQESKNIAEKFPVIAAKIKELMHSARTEDENWPLKYRSNNVTGK